MPIYEYQCEKCGHEFEREQRISDPPIRSCPECRGRKVKKLISRTTFVLKGGGWYADGYASKEGASKEGGSKEGGGSAKDGASSETKKTDSSTSKDKPKPKPKAKTPSASSSKSAA